MKINSILNNIIGPIMTGPSSSHTAAPVRIGRAVRQLLGEAADAVTITFDQQSAFAPSYRSQGSDYGFIGGIMGFSPEDPRLPHSLAIARNAGLEYIFVVGEIKDKHPGAVQFTLYPKSGKQSLSLIARSIGGGAFEIVELAGYPLSYTGEQDLFCAIFNDDAIDQSLQQHLDALPSDEYQYGFRKKKGGCLLWIKHLSPLDHARLMLAIGGNPALTRICRCRALLPVPVRFVQDMPFTDAATALTYHERQREPLWRMALTYEHALGLVEEEDILSQINYTLEIMRDSVRQPLTAAKERRGFMTAVAKTMAEQMTEKHLLAGDVFNEAMLRAVAAAEQNGTPGIVVASPTAGSCGVLPGALISAGTALGADRHQLVEALLAAGLVGAFIGNQASFSGDVAGCQAEVGAASAMAAAALTYLLDGSVAESFAAASLALQNLLGLICDPVAHQTDIPCINRNALGAVNAIMAANMIQCGFNPMIPLDETIRAMYQVGQALPPCLRCAGNGGLSATPTAQTIALLASKKCREPEE